MKNTEFLNQVKNKEVKYAMIPIENSLAGRVADIHYLLPTSDIYIVDEFFLPIEHQLIVVDGASEKTIKNGMSHRHALGQCRDIISELKLNKIVAADTAGSAKIISENNYVTTAVLASELGVELNEIMKKNLQKLQERKEKGTLQGSGDRR